LGASVCHAKRIRKIRTIPMTKFLSIPMRGVL
jgi:hypothetical protein